MNKTNKQGVPMNIKELNNSITKSDIEETLDELIKELEVVSIRFDKLYSLRKDNKATSQEKKELGELKRQSADLYFKIGVAKDSLKNK